MTDATIGSRTKRVEVSLLTQVVRSRFGKAALALLLPLGALVLWQASGTNGAVAGGALPTPDRVWKAWLVWAFGKPGPMTLSPYVGTWADAIYFSAVRVAKGFGLAVLVGVPLGIMIGWSRLAASMVDPTIQWLRPVPITAWLPISIAIFGISDFGAVFLITIGAFYPIVINTTQGARDVDKNWIRAALMMGASQWDVLRRVVLPAALPSIFTGLRIGLGIGWTAVIVSENGRGQIRPRLCALGRLLCRPDGHRDRRYGLDRAVRFPLGLGHRPS